MCIARAKLARFYGVLYGTSGNRLKLAEAGGASYIWLSRVHIYIYGAYIERGISPSIMRINYAYVLFVVSKQFAENALHIRKAPKRQRKE